MSMIESMKIKKGIPNDTEAGDIVISIANIIVLFFYDERIYLKKRIKLFICTKGNNIKHNSHLYSTCKQARVEPKCSKKLSIKSSISHIFNEDLSNQKSSIHIYCGYQPL